MLFRTLEPISVLAIALCAATTASCSSPASIDLCRRGDTLESVQEYVLTFEDNEGSPLSGTTVTAQAPSELDIDIPSNARVVRVVGRDDQGLNIARGTGLLSGESACVCVSRSQHYAAACENIACTVSSDGCQFFEQETRIPAQERTLRLSLNTDDTTPNVAADTYVREWEPNNNFGGDPELKISDQETALLRFDLDSIPRASTITAATVTLWGGSAAAGNGNNVTFHPILEEWQPGTRDGALGCPNWTCRSTTPNTDWSTPGCGAPGSRAQGEVAEIVTVTLETPHTVSLPTELVSSWLQQPEDNFGLALVADNKANFVSSEGTDGRRPLLEVTVLLD